MALLEIVRYPASILTTKSTPISAFDEALRHLAQDMFETMYAAEGVGLAAPQIGRSVQLFVMDCEGLKIVAANPQILVTRGIQKGQEACLSLDRIYSCLSRANSARLRAQDLNGNLFEIAAEGVAARCILHETDHCNGKLFISHLSPLQRDIVIRKLRKKEKQSPKRWQRFK
jgi:peptide deformylase